MTTYAYNAINAQGLEIEGEISAGDLAAAREQLRLRGLLAQRLDEVGEEGISFQTTVGKRVKPKSLQIFSRQFATMIEAGLNVVQALVILEQQTNDAVLVEVVSQLRHDVEGGLLLSEAMARHPKVFSRLYVSMAEAGEAAGILDIVLDRVAFQIEKQEAIRRRVKGAMIYPTMVLIFATLVLMGMLMFLVPIFVKIFASLNGQLPMLTQEVVRASNVLRNYWFIVIPLFVGAPFAFRWWKGTESGRRIWDRIKLRLPMKIGEETGELDKMLEKIADFYEDEVDAAVSSLTSIIEPVMMIAVGGMVGLIIISMYLPMFKMLSLVK